MSDTSGGSTMLFLLNFETLKLYGPFTAVWQQFSNTIQEKNGIETGGCCLGESVKGKRWQT
eukprot:2308858-Amphidinium_carterae.3